MQSEYQSCQRDGSNQTLLHAAQRPEPIFGTKLPPAGPDRLHAWVLRSGLIMAGMALGWMATAHWSVLTKSVSKRPVFQSYVHKIPSNQGFDEGEMFDSIVRGAVTPSYASVTGKSYWEDDWYVAVFKLDQVQNGHVYMQYVMSSSDARISSCTLGRAACMVSAGASPLIQEGTNRRGCVFYWRAVDTGCSDVTLKAYSLVEFP